MKIAVVGLMLLAGTATAQQIITNQPDPSHRGDPHWLNPYEYFCSPGHVQTEEMSKCWRVIEGMINEKQALPQARDLKAWHTEFTKRMKNT